jgi:hypothetical protein
MLCTYFDDSGTHANSSVVVIGGLIGTTEQWKIFNRGWAALLDMPRPGKPSLKLFHLSARQPNQVSPKSETGCWGDNLVVR